MSQDKQRQSDRQSLIKAHAAQAQRARRAALKVLKEFAQSPRGQAIRRAWCDAQERGLIPKIPEEVKGQLAAQQNETEEARNARLDEAWRRMQAESEEDRNARLDERWRQLQEEAAADAAPNSAEQPVKVEAPESALVEPFRPVKPPAHRAEKGIPRWDEAMNHLKGERTHRPRIIGTIDEVRIVKRWLSKRGVEIIEPTDQGVKRAELNPNLIVYSERQMRRRIKNWFDLPTR